MNFFLGFFSRSSLLKKCLFVFKKKSWINWSYNNFQHKLDAEGTHMATWSSLPVWKWPFGDHSWSHSTPWGVGSHLSPRISLELYPAEVNPPMAKTMLAPDGKRVRPYLLEGSSWTEIFKEKLEHSNTSDAIYNKINICAMMAPLLKFVF